MEGGGCIHRLPEECISHAIARTSPRDACRSEAVSPSFRSAAISNDVWGRFIPSDYAEFLARAVDRVEFASMKQLYFRLCDPILIDGGKMGFSVDRETGAKCFMLPARELFIVWGDTPHYWCWKHHPESRFGEVAELMNVCWLEIRGKIDSRMLSQRITYSAYLVFKLSSTSWGFKHPLQEGLVSVGAQVSTLSMRLMEPEDASSTRPPMRQVLRRPRFALNFFRRPDYYPIEPAEDLQEDLQHQNDQHAEPPRDRHMEPLEDLQGAEHPAQAEPAQDQTQSEQKMVGTPQSRRDGWKEILLGEFYNDNGDDGEVSMALLEIKGGNWKCGLIVHGIEIRPKK